MKTRTANHRSSQVNLGFQIAPMIDVVFVIMLFFMVMAGSVQTETRNRIFIPVGGPGLPPEEVVIRIDGDGQVSLNDDPLDSPDSNALPELAANLRKLRESNEAAKSSLCVTIHADEAARYQRVMDTMDALALADIAQVTFEAAAPE